VSDATLGPVDVSDTEAAIEWRLGLVFFASGFAAILYQLVWQRTLFAVVGINTESVTLIVTAFMVGLGLGSLVGGWLSQLRPAGLIARFAWVEIAVAGFGALSLPLFRAIGFVTLSLSPPQTALLTFLVLVCPTLGMGATLPLLAEYLVLRRPNVGASVGMLYSLNTLGSAVAALAGATVLFRMLGQQGVIWTAVACNLLAAVGARWLLKAARRNQ